MIKVCLFHVWTVLPLGFRPVPRVKDVLNGQSVKIFVQAYGSNSVPAETVDTDPSTRRPVRLWLSEEFGQSFVVEVVNSEFIPREVNNGDIATIAGKDSNGFMSAIGLGRIESRFSTGWKALVRSCLMDR